MYEMGDVAYKYFKNRAKRSDKKAIGREYSDCLLSCLSKCAGKEIDNEFVFSENSPVDFVWDYLSLGVECKRLKSTVFLNDGHAKAWLRSEFVNRFHDYSRETGNILNVGVLCVTEKKWSSEVDLWLRNLGYYVIETGQIDSNLERQKAESVFFEELTDVLLDIVENRALLRRAS
jgi:hypothetical protein